MSSHRSNLQYVRYSLKVTTTRIVLTAQRAVTWYIEGANNILLLKPTGLGRTNVAKQEADDFQ